MVEIIGFLGCFYLLVKGIEFLANGAYRTEEGWLKGSAVIGAILAFLGALLFTLWLLAQAGAFHYEPAPDPNFNADENLTTSDIENADSALNAAGEDVANAGAELNRQ